MEWCKMYANLGDDARVQKAEDDAGAAWLLMRCMHYCTKTVANHIPASQMRRFGELNQDTKLAALTAGDDPLLIEAGDGSWSIDPKVWSVEVHLTDQSERKKVADRERMRRIRAAAKGPGPDGPDGRSRDESDDVSRDMSADSSGTGSATVRDLHATKTATAAGHARYPQAPFRRSSGTSPGAGRVSAGQKVAGEQDVARQSATRSATVARKRREELKDPPNPPRVGGTKRCARHTRPRRGCADCHLPELTPVPDHCGQCSPARRIVHPDEHPHAGLDAGPCPNCHPSTVRTAIA